MLGTIKCFRFDERPRKKQDFGVAEHAARGTNKTSALPSMPPEEQTRLRRCRAWRPRNKQDFGVAERGARGTNKTSALPSMPPEEQTRLRRCRPCRPRNKQDFGVADHAARGTNKTSALPTMARPPLMWKWREYRIIRIGPIEATAKHHKPFPFPQSPKARQSQRPSRW